MLPVRRTIDKSQISAVVFTISIIGSSRQIILEGNFFDIDAYNHLISTLRVTPGYPGISICSLVFVHRDGTVHMKDLENITELHKAPFQIKEYLDTVKSL